MRESSMIQDSPKAETRRSDPAWLDQIRVLDFGWVWAGSIPGHVLADAGADVIKVETGLRLDPMRRGQPIIGDKPDPEQNTMHHNTNRNKRSFRVNLKDPRGLELVRRLAAKSDLVLENMSPGALRRLGLGYEDLRAINERIVYVSFPGMGQWGPVTDIITYGPCITALGGLDSLVGYEDGHVLGLQHGIADPTSGIFAAFMALVGLWRQQTTGVGSYIDLAQIDIAATMIPEALLDFAMNGRVARPDGNASPHLAPHGVYPSRDEDTWVTIATGSEEEWRALCRVMEHPEWEDDPRFADMFQRLHHRKELDRLISGWTSARTHDEATELLQAGGVAAAPVYNTADRLHSPFYQARGSHIDIEHPILGSEVIYGFPWKLCDTPLSIRRRAPFLGEHSEEILRDVLDMGEDEIEAVRDVLV
jgi:benzylsuccinate CoA-transferase BbsF subunit